MQKLTKHLKNAKNNPMKHQKIILSLIIICSTFGCSHNDELLIKYENGELAERFIVSNDINHNVKYISYHKNGNIREEGYIHSGERIGFWKQYYSDGIIRWQGEYGNGIRVRPSFDSSVIDRTKIVFKGITKDHYYAFRFVLTDSIPPDEVAYACKNVEITKIKDFDSCDFLIKPLNNDTIYIHILAASKNGIYKIFYKKIDPSMLKQLKK